MWGSINLMTKKVYACSVSGVDNTRVPPVTTCNLKRFAGWLRTAVIEELKLWLLYKDIWPRMVCSYSRAYSIVDSLRIA